MRIPRRRHAASETSVDARVVSVASSRTETDLLSTIRHPETYTPVPLAVNPMHAHDHKGALLQLVTAKAQQLHEAGGLDQDNLNALFHEIAAWRETWEARFRQDAESARHVAAMLLNQLHHNHRIELGRLDSIDRRLDEARQQHAAVLADSGFVTDPHLDTEALAQILERPASHLDGHLPRVGRDEDPTTRKDHR